MKFSYKYKKLTAILLVIILLVNLLSFYTFAETNTPEVNALEEVTMDDTLRTSGKVENTYNKIHFYVGDEDYAVIDDMTELKAATNELSEISSFAAANAARSGTAAEEYQITVQFASDFMETDEYKAFSEERSELDSIEEVREFRSRVNAFSKEYHDALVQKNIASLSVLECEGITTVEYSPFVVATVDPETINAETLVTFAASENIANISIAENVVPESEASWSSTLTSINAYNIVSNGTYTGEGIRIGIYEAGGICDTAHSNLAGKNITVRDASVTETNHATQVASILTAIAPDAEYYVSDVDRRGIGWFIQQGCDIVNCSFGAINPSGYRDDYDAVYDYQIRANFVVVVKSAGNYNNNPSSSGYNPQRKITSPGYAYNVITVGGVDGSSGNLVHDSGASYNCTSPQVKPNVSAMYNVTVNGFGTCSGTSYAAPQVAGCIALLLDMNPSFCTRPEQVMSLLTATAQKTQDYSVDVGDFNSKVGAGVIDLMKMLLNGQQHSMYYNTNGTFLSEVCSMSVYLEDGEQIQVSLSWLAYAVNRAETGTNVTKVCVTDYDILIYDPYNELAAISELWDSNVEMLRFTAEGEGSFRIAVLQAGAIDSANTGDYLSLMCRYC